MMMRKLFKIFLLLLAVFPLWLTIVAMASPSIPGDQWKLRLNEELLKIQDRKIQIVELLPTNADLPSEILNSKIQIDLSRININATSILGVKSLDEKGRLLHYVELPAKVLVQIKVAVAKRELKKGDRLSVSDIDWKWVDASTVARGPLTSFSSGEKEVSSYIPAGGIIYMRQLQAQTMIKRGDRLKIQVLGKGIKVSAVGIAQESGREGDTIRILNIDSKKEIYGRVRSSDEVEVHI